MKIAVIGLGYVGLPLAALFGRKYQTLGFDTNLKRIEELEQGFDRTQELDNERLRQATSLSFTSDTNALKSVDIYIVTVPTPVDKNNSPDLTPLLKASETVAKVLTKGNIVVYESTVYPGATEGDCVPILEKGSGLRFNKDFFCAYSPERINPGDKKHTVEKILKITSGSTPETAETIDQLYSSVIEAGTYKASSIKVAEAAKVIENSQRDINIAFVNELARIFNIMGIDTREVLAAAGTKWNFLPFQPGLVGGHCIGVDPYYLTYKAQEYNYHPEIILAGRRMNDTMPSYIAGEVVKEMIRKDHKVKGASILMLGITFKENCPDIRNSKAFNLYNELIDYGCKVNVYDPWADKAEVKDEYGIELIARPKSAYSAVVLAVAHSEFLSLIPRDLIEESGLVYDIKAAWPKEHVDRRL